MKIVMVHGRSQQGKSRRELEEQWLNAFRKGLQKQNLDLPRNLEIELPFFGDRLDYFTSSPEIPLSEDIQTKGNENFDQEYLQFRADVLEDLRRRANISDAHVYAEYGDDPQQRDWTNAKWIRAILCALDKNIPGMSSVILEVFIRDVFLYVMRSGVRDEIDNIVAPALSTEPSIVISHSLGTVVSYNILRRDPRALKVPLYVTLGSPLGIRSVRDQLRPLIYPKCVTRWYNAFDSQDTVALHALDEKNFPMRPSIENNGAVINDTENRHGIAGYLNDAEVAKRIHDVLVQRG